MEIDTILLFTHEYPPFKGGIGNYAEGVARALVRRGCRVILATPGSSGDQRSGKPRWDDPEIIRLPSSKGPKWLRVFRQAVYYRCIIKKFPSCFIHCLDTESWRIMSLLNVFGKCGYSLTVYGSDIKSTSSSIRFRLLGSSFLFRGLTSVSAISEFTRDLFLNHFSEWGDQLIPVAYPAPAEEICRLSKITKSPKKPAGQRLRILTVARIDQRKGHLFALSALQDLGNQIGQTFEWIVVGTPVDKEFYALFLRAVKQANFKVTLKEGLSMEDLAMEYQNADLFLLAGEIHPKRVEGFGMVYLEAGLFGVPSVGTQVGGTGEAVVDGVSGLLSQPGDKSALVHNLRTLFEKDGLREQMGIAAKEHALSFTWDRTAAEIFQNRTQKLT